MKFSIIIPVYNVEKFLEKCLQSVLNQNFKDYEVIAVNDGSTDKSIEILEKYKYNEKVRIIHQNNKGLGGARNTGILNAKGEYLFFLDSDDYIKNDTLVILEQYLREGDFDILAFDCNLVDEFGNMLQIHSNNKYVQRKNNLTKKQFMLFEPTFCTKIYKRELFMKHNIFFPEHLWYEDLATIYKLVPYTKKIAYLKEPLYFYVQQSQSITHSKNIYRIKEVNIALNSEIDFFVKNNFYETYREELEYICVLHGIYYSSFRIFKCGCKVRYFNKLFDYWSVRLPYFKKNKYIKQAMQEKYMFKHIINKKWYLFYIKEILIPQFINIFKWS